MLSDQAFNALVATAIVSITLTPLLYRAAGPADRWARRRPWLARLVAGRKQDDGPAAMATREQHHAIVVGYGPVGQTMVRLLRANEIVPVVLEMNLDTVHRLHAEGITALFGDATHPETLRQAGLAEARVLILTSSGPGARDLIMEARRLNPAIPIIARTAYLREAHELTNVGANSVFSGEGEVALSMTEYVLENLSATPEQIDRESERIRRELFAAPHQAGAPSPPAA